MVIPSLFSPLKASESEQPRDQGTTLIVSRTQFKHVEEFVNIYI